MRPHDVAALIPPASPSASGTCPRTQPQTRDRLLSQRIAQPARSRAEGVSDVGAKAGLNCHPACRRSRRYGVSSRRHPVGFAGANSSAMKAAFCSGVRMLTRAVNISRFWLLPATAPDFAPAVISAFPNVLVDIAVMSEGSNPCRVICRSGFKQTI